MANDDNKFGLTRRGVVTGALAAGALGMSGRPLFADPQWKKYAGTSIEVNSSRARRLRRNEQEFVELTGIAVSSDKSRAAAARS